MFLSVEWAKRWLPAVFLLLSLFLPWWTMIDLHSTGVHAEAETYYFPPFESFKLSFLWSDSLRFLVDTRYSRLCVGHYVKFFNIPFLFVVSSLILLSALCGLSDEKRTRTLGGLLGMIGIVSYSIIILPESSLFITVRAMGNPFLGIYPPVQADYHYIWFLSFGFYLALAGSLMLLSPTFRTLIERLRKRL